MKLDWRKKHIKHKCSIYFKSCSKKEGLTNKFQICDKGFGSFGEITIIGVSQYTIQEKNIQVLFVILLGKFCCQRSNIKY